MASASDCKKMTQVCGHVPLAIKLLCFPISENEPVELSQYLENYLSLEASTDLIQMLDNPDYPSNLRLQVLFDTSFQRLSEEEKRALVSLAILPDNFHLDIAAAVLGLANTARASKILQRLRRKSLLDSGTTHGLFSIHKLIQSFSREKGEQKMQETVSCAKSLFVLTTLNYLKISMRSFSEDILCPPLLNSTKRSRVSLKVSLKAVLIPKLQMMLLTSWRQQSSF